MPKENSTKFLSIVALIIILVTNIFLFVPLTIYISNTNEFIAPIGGILQIYSIPVLVLFLLLLVIGAALKGALYHRYKVLLAVLGILFWLQGAVLVWEYGILDGRQIDWSQDSWRGWLDLGIWSGVIVASLVFYKSVEKVVVRFAYIIFIMQILILLFTIVGSEKLYKQKITDSGSESLQEIYKFSPDVNVLELFIDGFQADVFEDLIKQDVFGFRQKLNGFVFFNETLGSFPYTRFAVPAFVSGKIYNNDMAKNDFIKSVLKDKTILNTAAASGFEVDFVSDAYWSPLYASGKHKNLYILHNNKNDDPALFYIDNATRLLDLTLFRLTPHFFKKYIYNDQRWLINPLFSDSESMNYRYFSHTYFVNKLIKNMSIERNAPVYKFIHIMNTHNPMVVAPDCSYAGGTVETNRLNLTIQSKCTLDTVVRLFNKMKELGIYDKTLIIMHADHGGWVPTHRFNKDLAGNGVVNIPPWIASLASPLLAVKPINATGDLKISSALVSLTDIPDTISSLMNWNDRFSGRSVLELKENEPRVRKFYFYTWQRDAWETDYTDTIQEFIINGSHYDTPWNVGRQINPPQKNKH